MQVKHKLFIPIIIKFWQCNMIMSVCCLRKVISMKNCTYVFYCLIKINPLFNLSCVLSFISFVPCSLLCSYWQSKCTMDMQAASKCQLYIMQIQNSPNALTKAPMQKECCEVNLFNVNGNESKVCLMYTMFDRKLQVTFDTNTFNNTENCTLTSLETMQYSQPPALIIQQTNKTKQKSHSPALTHHNQHPILIL